MTTSVKEEVKQKWSYMSIVEKAFVAGRSKTSWEQFQKDNRLPVETEQESQELFDIGESVMMKLLPPEEYGESYDAETLYHVLEDFRDSTSELKKQNHELLEALKGLLPLAEDGYTLHKKNGSHQEFLSEDRERLATARALINKHTISKSNINEQ